MTEAEDVDLPAVVAALGLLTLALYTGVVWTVHVTTLLAVYALVAVVAAFLAMTDRTPRRRDVVGLAVVVLLLVAVPVAARIGRPPGGMALGGYVVGFVAARWAVPIALTVSLGLIETRERREALVAVHLLAVALLSATESLLLGGELGTWLSTTPQTVGFYVLAVVGSYPAARLLDRGRAFDRGVEGDRTGWRRILSPGRDDG